MCDNSSPTVEASIFDSNFGTDHAGAIAMHSCTGMRIVNNLFRRNHTQGNLSSGKGGGAIHAYRSNPTIVNNTFVDNYVGTGTWPDISTAAYGGAIHVRGSQGLASTIVNNIFYDNRATVGRSVACTSDGTYVGLANVSYCDARIDNNSAGGQTDHYYQQIGGSQCNLGSTISYVVPGFSDIADGSYWLVPASTLRVSPNHGQSHADNVIVPESDITGKTRPGDGYTDMGAYESDTGNYP